MERTIFILALGLCLLLSDGARTQHASPTIHGLEIQGGVADGLYTRDSRSETGCWFGPAMSRYAKDVSGWAFGAEFLNRYYPYKSEYIPITQFTAEEGYYYKSLVGPSRAFFPYLGGSVLAGYKSVNRGERWFYDGPTFRHHDCFLYGGAVTLEVGIYLIDRIILLLTGRERILWGTTTGHFHTQSGLGVKFITH